MYNLNIFFGWPSCWLVLFVPPRSTETLASEGAMLSVVDWLLGWLFQRCEDVSQK